MTDPLLKVFECDRCGRLWVFTEDDTLQVMGYLAHARPRCTWYRLPRGVLAQGCDSTPVATTRPDVEAAFHVGGREAAEAMIGARWR